MNDLYVFLLLLMICKLFGFKMFWGERTGWRLLQKRVVPTKLDTHVFIKGKVLLTIGYTNFSHVTIVFIAKYLFTGSVKILNKFISMRNPEITYCLYSEKFK